MTLAKGLGSGVPVGAMLASDKVASAFAPGSHASTFGGNPLVCAAAIATLETLLEDGFMFDQCKRMGEYLQKELKNLQKEFSSVIIDVRGLGLMIGTEFVTAEIRDAVIGYCRRNGLLLAPAGAKIIRTTPALVVTIPEIDEALTIFETALDEI